MAMLVWRVKLLACGTILPVPAERDGQIALALRADPQRLTARQIRSGPLRPIPCLYGPK